MAWTSTSSPSTIWVAVSPGSVISQTLLSQIQAEVAAAQAAAAAAAASAVEAAEAQADAEEALTAANAAVITSQENAANAESFANQVAIIAASLTPIPVGGTTDQVLAKATGADYDYYWKDDEGGVGGSVDGSGTAGKLTKWSDSDTVTDSIVSESGTVATVAGSLALGAPTATTGTIRLEDQATVVVHRSGSDHTMIRFGGAVGSNSIIDFGVDFESSINFWNQSYLDFWDADGVTRAGRIIPQGSSGNEGLQVVGLNRILFNTGALTGTTQMTLVDGSLTPAVTNDVDLGSTSLRFKDGWFAGTITGPGSGITALNGSNIASGTVDPARLGSGSSITTKFLRGDSTWQTIAGGGDALTSGSLAQFAATTSAELRGVLSDETGTGSAVFATTPTLVTPVLGAATATSINKVAITAPATSATLTIADGATLTASATATVSGTNTGDQTSVTGNAGTATALQTSRNINGVAFNGTADITVAAAAGTLTGATLAAGVTASSLTSVGTLSALTMGGTLALVDNLVTRPYLQDYAEVVNAIGNSTGTLTVDYTSGNVATATLTGNITTFSITNPSATGRGASITLYLTQDGTGGRTVTWGSSVKWASGTAPTLGTANQVDIVVLSTLNAGTTWFASHAGTFTP